MSTPPEDGRHRLMFSPELSVSATYDEDASVVLHNGDAMGFLATMPDEAVQLVVTSPPYNVGKEYETTVGIDAYLQAQDALIPELVRVLRPGGSICWQVGNYVEDGEVFPLDIFYYRLLRDRGLRLRNRIIWRFGHGLHATKRFSGRYETILWFTKGDPYTFNLDPVRVPSKYPGKRHFKGPKRGQLSGNPKGKNPSDIWDVVAADWESLVWDIPNVKSNHPEKTAHPCQFPVELVERCVLALSDPGDTVLDPYCGVGSAIIASIRHDRRAVGCDRETAYVAEARSRIAAFADGTLRLRPLGRPVHAPSGRDKLSQMPLEWEQATDG